MTCGTCKTLPAPAGQECPLCIKRREQRAKAAAAQRRRRAEKGLPADWNEVMAARMKKMRAKRAAEGLTCRGVAPLPCRECLGPRTPGLRTPLCLACKGARDAARAVAAVKTAERRAAQRERDRRLWRLLGKGGQNE